MYYTFQMKRWKKYDKHTTIQKNQKRKNTLPEE